MTQYTHGMNVAQVQGHLATLRSLEKELRDIETQANQAATTLTGHWGGPDSDSFRSEWPKHRAALTSMADDVAAMAKAVAAEIEQQNTTSQS